MMLTFDLDAIADSAILTFEDNASSFPELTHLASNRDVEFVAPVSGSVELKVNGKLFVVSGELVSKIALSCASCLDRIERKITNNFSVTYVRELVNRDDEEEVELSGADLEFELFEGSIIDVTEVVQEQVIMAVPIKELCSPDCKGVCQFCGANMNTETCDCEPPIFNNKFGDLKKISFDK